ncbi:MAG TPA: ABC transporter permease [Bdellovibrio sp.]|uniref:ABC transporter permease n=1 Tax=Bdellovibrio sp. TaxID=28201 RepID=UPI002EE6041C
MTGLHRKLLRDFKTLRSQILMLAILIICGVSVLVSSWSSYQSLQRSKEAYYRQFHFADIFAELVRAPQSVATNLRQLDGVEQVESRIIKDGLVDVPGQTEPALGRFISWRGPHQTLNNIYLRQGRMPEASSLMEVLVHESFAVAHHLKTGDRLRVLLAGQQRTVVISGIGLSPEYVYALSPVASLPDDKHFGVFWLRHEDLEYLTGLSGAFNSVQIKVSEAAKSRVALEELKRQIDRILEPYGNIQSYDRSRQLSNMFVEDEIRQQRVMAILMPSIFMSVAMFILNVVFSRLISLHRGQIATLKSLGYSRWALTFHYFQLVTLILFTGILPSFAVGAGIGHWYAGLYKDFFRFPTIDFTLSLDSLGLGLFAGLIPGWLGAAGALTRVFYLLPAESLRPPSPPPFQKGFFEKLRGGRSWDVFSKMILRSLLFRPLRLVLNILGIAAALSILINGSFWTDVIDFMIQRQFHEMRREDLSVRLLHPKKMGTVSDIRNIRGVLMVEGERSVPVLLRYKNFKKDISILGLDKSLQLNRVMDQSGNVIQPKEGGILLSRYFETQFHLQVGDLVSMKAQEGEQREFQVPVMGFVDDLIGQQAYALKGDLHRWLREESVVDTLLLKIDPEFIDRIYVSLKEMPEVAAISVRKLLLESFTKTIADMIVTFTIILYLFAAAIAGAVIYNSARISFSERAWEMASLRILGYGIRTAFELLFLDIGLQLILALVPGLIFGYYLSYLSTHFIHNDTFKFPLVVNPVTYGLGVLVLLLIYFSSGIFLFQKIKKLDFSEALKARD